MPISFHVKHLHRYPGGSQVSDVLPDIANIWGRRVATIPAKKSTNLSTAISTVLSTSHHPVSGPGLLSSLFPGHAPDERPTSGSETLARASQQLRRSVVWLLESTQAGTGGEPRGTKRAANVNSTIRWGRATQGLAMKIGATPAGVEGFRRPALSRGSWSTFSSPGVIPSSNTRWRGIWAHHDPYSPRADGPEASVRSSP